MDFFNCISLLQIFEDRSGVNSYNKDIIGVPSDIIVASLMPPNPDIWVKMSWNKNHFPKCVR